MKIEGIEYSIHFFYDFNSIITLYYFFNYYIITLQFVTDSFQAILKAVVFFNYI